MTPELHRPVLVDRADGLETLVQANEAELGAVAARLGLAGLGRLTCRFALRAEGSGRFACDARLQARATQTCVVTLDEFEVELEERFTLRFVPEGTEQDDLDPETEDEVPYAGGSIDLGEAAVEQLALLLDPYPRRPGAELSEAAADETANPFAALARLRPKH